ncbi:MAG: DegT/DnrJ/EryC1/StrS family aminotransferase [Candidatus Omnitrophica bacterium]|nr:DegT/DnrJ/EryC1/StrS family aminotransferase [Candidatus Omnitrophota bacterium]
MSLLREIPPTAGWPLTIRSLISSSFKKHPKGLLEEDFKRCLGASDALLTYSGTAAFYLILETIKKISNKKTVIIPAFICPLIPLAIKKAGLKVKICDTNAYNFDFDINKLKDICKENGDILAILAIHLGGLPIDFYTLKEIAKVQNAFIIEDCAQSLGAQYHDQKTGTLGEFAFFSLCRGKGLSIYEGGIAVTNQPEYIQILKETAVELINQDTPSECLKITELFAYSIFYRPELFWFAFKLPQIFWQIRNKPIKAMGEYFDSDFPIHKVSAFREYIGHINFPYLDEKINQQRQKVDIYLKGLADISAIKPITEAPQTIASYPYLAIILNDKKKRDLAMQTFRNSGLGISQVYLYAITDYEYLRGIIPDADCPNSRLLAERIVTLSTSSFLKESDLQNIIKKIKKI